jgi:hypothetical protein
MDAPLHIGNVFVSCSLRPEDRAFETLIEKILTNNGWRPFGIYLTRLFFYQTKNQLAMSGKFVLLKEEDLKDILNETFENFYENIYQNRHGLGLFPAKEEIIDRKELGERLNITEPTNIRWEKKKKIPVMKIGSAVRYNWRAVIKSLEKNG